MGDAPERIFYDPVSGKLFLTGPGIKYLRADIATAREAELRAEVERCHARLEIDHAFTAGPDDQLVQHEIPMAERASMPDGIECRDDTIRLQDEQITRLRALLDEAQKSRQKMHRRAQKAEAAVAEARWGLDLFDRYGTDWALNHARAHLAKIGGQ
jgi:hypothetical protein